MNDGFLLPEPILRGSQRSYSISVLWEATSALPTQDTERQLLGLVLPPWQRPVVWTEQQQISFLEGVFLGLGTGFYVVNGRDFEHDGEEMAMSGWLIDGQQRITAIARFLHGELSVFNGIRYADMRRGEQRRRFDNVIFPCIELDYQSDENVLKELYRRLNFSGTAHTAADLALLDR